MVRASLEILLKKYCEDVKVVSSAADANTGIELINNYKPELVFLDIRMPGLDGFDVLDRIQYRDFHLIFSTGYVEYALRAIKQRAVDYLVKPVSKHDVIRAIEKVKKKTHELEKYTNIKAALKELHEAQPIRIAVPDRTGIELVMPDDILYIEAHSNRSVVVLSDGSVIEATKALKDYEGQLCGKELNFIRIHNSYIINVNYVTKYLKEDGGYAIIQDKKTIPVSRHKKEEFLNLINFRP